MGGKSRDQIHRLCWRQKAIAELFSRLCEVTIYAPDFWTVKYLGEAIGVYKTVCTQKTRRTPIVLSSHPSV